MLANRKRKRPAETWGNATSPNWTFARHDGKNGAVFPSFFLHPRYHVPPCGLWTAFMNYLTLFLTTRARWKFQGPFSWQARLSIFEYVADFSKNFSFLFADALEQGWVVVLSFPNSLEPQRKEFNASCILLCESCSEWLASDEVYFPWLQIQAPFLVNNDKKHTSVDS